MTCSDIQTLPLELTCPKPESKLATPAETSLSRVQLIEAVACIMRDIIESKCTGFADASEVRFRTPFHARTLPSIPLEDYLERFSRFSKCEDDVLILALIYLDRVGERFADFCLDTFNVHKLLLISMTVACKFSSDKFLSNDFYSKIGGISIEEFNALEQEFLINYTNFVLFVKPETYKAYSSDICSYYQNKLQQKSSRI